MRQKRIAVIIGLACLTILEGCATTSESGPPIDHARLDSLVKGKSTKADAQAALGMANGSQTLPNGSSQLVYTHSTTAITSYGPIPVAGKSAFTWEECRLNFDSRGLYAGSECNATGSNPSTR